MNMKKVFTVALPLLMALPTQAMAAYVTITTTVQGVLDPQEYTWGMLYELDMPMALYDSPQPYSLTVQSTVDPDKAVSYGDGNRYVRNSDMKVTFQLGDYTYTDRNAGETTLSAGADYYSLSLRYMHWNLQFSSRFIGAQGSLGGDMFAPRNLSATGASAGYAGVVYYRGMNGGGTPEASEYIFDSNATRATLSITSAVPEPAHWAMLAAGLLTIAATARAKARKHDAA